MHSGFYMVSNALGIPFSELLSFPSGKVDKHVEAQIMEIPVLLRGFGKKKQTMLLSAIKGLISGLDKI